MRVCEEGCRCRVKGAGETCWKPGLPSGPIDRPYERETSPTLAAFTGFASTNENRKCLAVVALLMLATLGTHEALLMLAVVEFVSHEEAPTKKSSSETTSSPGPEMPSVQRSGFRVGGVSCAV